MYTLKEFFFNSSQQRSDRRCVPWSLMTWMSCHRSPAPIHHITHAQWACVCVCSMHLSHTHCQQLLLRRLSVVGRACQEHQTARHVSHCVQHTHNTQLVNKHACTHARTHAKCSAAAAIIPNTHVARSRRSTCPHTAPQPPPSSAPPLNSTGLSLSCAAAVQPSGARGSRSPAPAHC